MARPLLFTFSPSGSIVRHGALPDQRGWGKSVQQKRIYDEAYRGEQRVRRWLRFDIRYRCRRLQEVLGSLRIDVARARVLDVGFGTGELLASFPVGCAITGAEISASAVERAHRSPRLSRHASRHFQLIPENGPEALPRGPFDIVLSSHVLEHVDDDSRWLRALHQRVMPGGTVAVFVPIETPGYNPDHVRVYSLESLCALVESVGLQIVHTEGSMHLNGHVWKWLTLPSRKRWPVLGPLVNTLRLLSQAVIPYPLTRTLERWAARAGLGPRQALVVARAPS
ncbi:MAG: class I SAM-dependent methyltransferase [Polyangiaceae bacterium]|nr:class I SAM-dependent methyltransferase [Polyangiaceae bacterium]